MNVGELINELRECNEEATISSIFQSIEDSGLYETKAITTEIKEGNRVNILVRDINDRGITVKRLLDSLGQYDKTLPIFVKEWTLKPPRRVFEILNVNKGEEIVFLEIPQKLANFKLN